MYSGFLYTLEYVAIELGQNKLSFKVTQCCCLTFGPALVSGHTYDVLSCLGWQLTRFWSTVSEIHKWIASALSPLFPGTNASWEDIAFWSLEGNEALCDTSEPGTIELSLVLVCDVTCQPA